MPRDSASDAALAGSLIRSSATAALATLQPDGGPFASYVTTAPASDGSPLLLLSRLALHRQNLDRDPRASLLFVREPAAGSDQMTAARVTLGGRVLPDEDAATAETFLARHPDAAGYASFTDFAYYRFHVAAAYLVAGFGRIVRLAPEDVLCAAMDD